MFIYLNANPSDIHTGDCVIRAIMQSFNAFAQQMQCDPRAQAQQMMNSGQMNQQQFEWCRQMANQIMGTNL